MPALQMFGRRWAIAADDVPVLAFPAALFHLIWFIFLVVAFSAISKPSSCANTASYEACIIGLFICFFLSACLESWLAVEGMRGTLCWVLELQDYKLTDLVICHRRYF